MRVWDVPVEFLCDKHLLAQHLEVHTMYSVIVNNKKGYAAHPETMRWRNNLPELVLVHEQTAAEMTSRGMNHKSPLMPAHIALLRSSYGVVDTVHQQINKLYMKGCLCDTTGMVLWYAKKFNKEESAV